jgi:simple sugar transport system substrate-binding protein
MNKKRLILISALIASVLGCGRQEPPPQAAKKAEAATAAAAPLKVGFVYVSPVGEAGWTAQHDAGRRQLESALGDRVRVTYVDKVPEGADAERVIRDLASQGNKLIFTTSFGFMAPTLKVASEFPDTIFEHATGYKTASNVANYNIRFYEGRYLGGIVAGRMTKTNTLGYVAAFPIPEVLQGINAYTLGARSVNPKVQVRVIWTGSWYDPGRERDAAMTLIGQGADVLTHHTDSTAVVAAAEEKGVRAVAYHSDMAKFGPNAQIAAVTHHWGDYYVRRTREVLDGKWATGSVWMGMGDGAVRIEGLGKNVPQDVADLVAARAKEIAAGTFHPFTGPIATNEGKPVAAKGERLTDAQLNEMNYYVEGVLGKVPAK